MELLSNWRTTLPLAGLGMLAATGVYFLFKPKKEDPDVMERERRAYLNRIGRIVEGQVTEVVDGSIPSGESPSIRWTKESELVLASQTRHSVAPRASKAAANAAAVAVSSRLESGPPEPEAASISAHSPITSNGSRKLLYYTYSISGVTYETAQDITGLEAQLHITRIATGQTASVKYDPANPSNSILLADGWSGLH
jgi:hypothetical protein